MAARKKAAKRSPPKRAAPKWQKAPLELVERFLGALPDDPLVERRKMFGYNCAFPNGQMFAGIFQRAVMLRLGEPERSAFLALPGAGPFEPMPGRPMKEYVTVPAAIAADRRALAGWVRKSPPCPSRP